MNDPEQTVAWPPGIGESLPGPFSAYDDSSDVDDRTSDYPTAGLVSLGFIGAALRRRALLWCTIAVAGLLIGSAWYVKFPAAQKATTSVLLVDNPNLNPGSEVQTDIAMAESTPVAGAVIRQLGLQQTPSSFVGTYTITQVSDQVLTITAGAPTSGEAVRRASAIATQFLKFRARYTKTQQQQTEAQLNQQITQAQQHIDSISKQISQVSSQPGTSDQQAKLSSLQAQREAATTALAEVRQYVTSTLASTRSATQAMVQGSQVLNAAATVKHSFLKGALLYAVGGLVGGLAVGIAIVVVGAVTSDRLRRRDDIAYALGAPVTLSVGRVQGSRLVPVLRRGTARNRDMERLVEHLRSAVPGNPRGPSSLGVVAVDNASAVAQAVVDLAVSSAKQRWRVVLADLSAGAHAARLLRADTRGVSTVNAEGAPIAVMVPAADDVAPAGPLQSHASPDGNVKADEPLAAAYAGADLVLSLVTLDPAFGGEHLATWATEVVAVVTAGQSTAVRIHAVGEMIRLAGTHLCSVVVIDADKSDESLGTTSALYQPA